MSLHNSDAPHEGRATRRRGAELEAALLDATWAELIAHGYDELSYGAVAVRARTSRAVLYRRWPAKPELVRAAVGHAARMDDPEVPDTGSLRGDLIELLRRANRDRVRVGLILASRLSGYFRDTRTALADLREVFIGGREPLAETVYRRAAERGEIDPARLTPRLRSLAFDLFRGEVLMTHQPLPEATITEIVDDIVLPLVTGTATREDPPKREPQQPDRTA